MDNRKRVLGIETSCDDTSVALIEFENNVPPNILYHKSFSQNEIFTYWGGVIPEIAARNHNEKIYPLLKNLFKNYELESISLIGVTNTPGLLGPLLSGLHSAKTLSLLNGTPLVPVNHIHAHLEAIHLDQEVSYPYLGLVVSGGHGIFFLVRGPDEFTILGKTLDDAPGEAFDKGGKLMGLSYPAGPIIDKYAKLGNIDKTLFSIPLKNRPDCDLSYSGLKTSLKYYLEKNKPQLFNKEGPTQVLYDLCASYQWSIVECLRIKLKTCLKGLSTPPKTVVVGGGVACNSFLRKILSTCHNNVKFVSPKFCTDNGAMVANMAYRSKYKLSVPDLLTVDAYSNYFHQKGTYRV